MCSYSIRTLALSRFSNAGFFSTGVDSSPVAAALLWPTDGPSCKLHRLAAAVAAAWSVEYCGDSVWFETSSLLYSKLCCYNRAFFKTVVCKMLATKDRIIGCIPPISTSPLYLLIPSFTQRRISRKAKQAYTIGMGVRTTSSNATLDHIVDWNANVYTLAYRFLSIPHSAFNLWRFTANRKKPQ